MRALAKRRAGSHVIVDLYGASSLDDLQAIERCLQRCVEKAGGTLLHLYLHPFATNGGVSGVAVLAESHISIHTWPEHCYAAVDVFMCGKARPQICVEVMRDAFAPERCVVQELPRGTLE
jgi:S-adenosylmethionine decarboxylase